MREYYRDEYVTIYHGDCRFVCLGDLGAHHVITDPPYDEKTHDGAKSTLRPDWAPIGFLPLETAEVVPLLQQAVPRWVVSFCALEMLGDYKRISGDRWVRAGFWHRLGGAPQFTGDRPAQPGEGIAIMRGTAGGRMWWNGGGGHAFFQHPIIHGGKVHPTQKPESLMLELITLFTDPGETILDPFMGSGTTLVAAKRLGRKAIGFEISEQFCKEAVNRLKQNSLGLFSVPENRDLFTGGDL